MFSNPFRARQISRTQARQMERAKRKNPNNSKIPFLGVFVRACDVRRHRYLKAHGLPFSASLAKVVIRGDVSSAAAALV